MGLMTLFDLKLENLRSNTKFRLIGHKNNITQSFMLVYCVL